MHGRRLSRDGLEEISTFGGSGISGFQRESGYQKRLCANENQMETHSMSKCTMSKRTLLGVAAILSTAIATPALAQAVSEEPGAVVGRGTTDAMASLPLPGSLMAGSETTTRPWSAPIGHRQPRVADIPPSTSVTQQTLDKEDAEVDRKISGVCRGC
jgi:hypothetical protein